MGVVIAFTASAAFAHTMVSTYATQESDVHTSIIAFVACKC